MIVLFPLKENAFSDHCEVNKNNFGSEKLAIEQVLTFNILYLKVCKVRCKSSGTGVEETIYHPF